MTVSMRLEEKQQELRKENVELGEVADDLGERV